MIRLRALLATALAGALLLSWPAGGLELPRVSARALTAGVLEYTTTPQKTAPANGCISITPSGTAFAQSAWVEIFASTSTDIVLTGMTFDPAVDGGEWQVAIGTGGAGAETSLGRFATAQNVNEGRTGSFYYPARPGIFIASGTRVAFRMAKFGTSTSAWCAAFTYHEAPMTGQATYFAPAANELAGFGGVSTTPSGSNWGNSNWFQWSASTATNIVLHSFTSTWLCVGGDGYDYEWDIGTGGAGSETVKHTLRNAFLDTNGICTLSGGANWTPIWPALRLPSGVRVAMRQRKEGTATSAMFPTALYIASDSGLSTIYTQQPSTVVPATANGSTITTAAGWASTGTYVEFIASAATDLSITGMLIRTVTSNEDYQFDIAVGGAGSEVVKRAVAVMGNAAEGDFFYLVKPALNIAPGDRVAIRGRTAVGNRTVNVNLVYIASPDFDQRTSNSGSVYPHAAAGVSVTPNGTAWNDSGWTQLVASTSTNVIVTDIQMLLGGGTPRGIEIDLGTGAASSESVITTARTHYGGPAHSQVQSIDFTYPVYVPSGSRLAVRMRAAGTNTTAFGFKVNYVEYTAPAAASGQWLFNPFRFCCSPRERLGGWPLPKVTPRPHNRPESR